LELFSMEIDKRLEGLEMIRNYISYRTSFFTKLKNNPRSVLNSEDWTIGVSPLLVEIVETFVNPKCPTENLRKADDPIKIYGMIISKLVGGTMPFSLDGSGMKEVPAIKKDLEILAEQFGSKEDDYRPLKHASHLLQVAPLFNVDTDYDSKIDLNARIYEQAYADLIEII
jgi:hypothetical protein